MSEGLILMLLYCLLRVAFFDVSHYAVRCVAEPRRRAVRLMFRSYSHDKIVGPAIQCYAQITI